MTITDRPGPGPNRTPRWMWIALLLSVALNLVIVGMAAAAMLHFRSGHGIPGERYERFITSLPGDRQQAMRAAMAEQRAAIRPLRRKSREARRKARDAFVRDPIDQAGLSAAYVEATAARNEIAKVREAWLTKVGALLTADQRKDFLKLRHRGDRWRRHPHTQKGDGE